MLTIAFVSQKGGAGKSTLSANLAAYAASNGMKTAVLDLDPQASVSAWHGLREAEDITLIPSHPPLVSNQVKGLEKDGYELCIVDTPPHNSTAAANAINASDLTVIPVRPSAFDLAGAQSTFDLMLQNKAKGGAVLMAVPPNSSVESAAMECSDEYSTHNAWLFWKEKMEKHVNRFVQSGTHTRKNLRSS